MATADVTSIIHALAPSFDANPAVALIIPLAQAQLSSETYGTHYDYACALLTLHLLSGDAGGAAGAVASLKDGDQSVSFHAPEKTDDLGSTHWGQKLRALQRSVIFPIAMAGMQ